MATIAPDAATQQTEDEIRKRSRTRCIAMLYGSYRAGSVTWDGVVLEAETWETQEALRAALRDDFGITVQAENRNG